VTDEPTAAEPTAAEPAAADPAAALHALLAATVAHLESVGARDEALAVVKDPRGIGPFKTQTSMQPTGRAYRLGVILLDTEGRLFRVGKITRATDTGWPQNLSASVEQRRADRRAASRGHFVDGDVVNHGHVEIPQDREHLTADSDPVSFDGEHFFIRWGTTRSERRRLDLYLADRSELLETERIWDDPRWPDAD
jgi:hypothetical protein